MNTNWNEIKHFRREEFKKDPDKISPQLVKLMDGIREVSGFPIVIHVAWDDSGHAPNSYHYKGLAVDFHWVASLDRFPYLEQFLLLSQFREIGGIGFYPHWNHPGWHIDLRPSTYRMLWFRDAKGKYHYELFNLFEELKKHL